MGVLGLTPFLQKTCPGVIKHLPERFRALAGKTLVIDGTLITQRFHYAQAPHAHRHVLGWYKLIQELRDSNVSAICVFDGKERNIAKAREAERRKEVQRQTIARGVLEQERLKRLRKLSNAFYNFDRLQESSKAQTTRILDDLRVSRQNTKSETLQVPLAPPLETLPKPVRDEEPLSTASTHELTEGAISPLGSTPETAEAASFGVSDAELHGAKPVPDEPSPSPSAPHWRTYIEDLQAEDFMAVSELTEEPTMSPEQLAQTLKELYHDFQKSSDLLASITARAKAPLTALPPTDPEVQADILATKAQHQLSINEGAVWDNLLSGHPATVASSSSDLANLEMTSQAMYDSFNRRMNTPTFQTYQECREILNAMGVPCIEPSGAFEGEALASSMVRHGLADYVASEDTDVLVYEAPLIRNLTNRQQPLTVISGADIRDVLNLDRSSFIDFVLLLGTDFSQRIKNVGPARALKFIREYGSIERVIASENKYPPRIPEAEYLQQVDLARSVFQTLPPVPEKDAVLPRVCDEDNVVKVLQKYNLGRALLAESSEWDYTAALGGNYFSDDPSIY